MDLPPFVKEHPALTIGIVAIGGVMLFALMGGSGSASPTVITSPGQDPAIAAASINAAATAQHDQTALMAQRENLATQLAMAQNTSLDNIVEAIMAKNLEETRLNTQVTAAKYVADRELEIANRQIDASVATQLASLEVDRAKTLAGLQVQQNIADLTAQMQVGIASTSANLQLGLSRTAADVQKTVSADAATLGAVNTQTAAQVQLASIGADLQKALSALDVQRDTTVAQINQQAKASKDSKDSSIWGTIGSIAGTLLSFL